MNHEDHVRLLRGGVPEGSGGVWADFGSGAGAFTLALADLIGGGQIYSVDKDARALREQAATMRFSFPNVHAEFITADFTRPLPTKLPPLDGIVMANSLHYVKHKEGIVGAMLEMLKPDGRFVLVEYNSDHGNPWVPYPLSYETWHDLAQSCGFAQTRLLTTIPSRFLGEIYSALSVVDE
jgi:ubiquinone/menaquinone biosynthesis C-methylase UbiE